MKIGVIQHRVRTTPAENVRVLVDAVRTAVGRGAEMVVMPCVVGVAGDAIRDAVAAEIRVAGESCAVFAPTCFSLDKWGVVDSVCCLEGVGSVLAMCGDACFDVGAWETAATQRPTLAVLSPLAESELQAEAALEVALGLSDSLCGLVVVSECAGAEIGEPGHGGSAVVSLGDVVAEAFGEDDLLLVDVEVPIAQPEPRAPLPEIPTILAQRVAVHAGRKPEVAYLADLSNGPQRR